jgi:ubiquinone/menaquinone biosynthesis C-methylase UbiE
MNQNNYKIEIWKKGREKYQDYWNDEKVKSVANNVSKNEFISLEEHIKDQGFIIDFEKCITRLDKSRKKLSGIGAEFASGTMWLTSYIMNKFNDQINYFYSIDYSEYYVRNLGKKLLEHYKVDSNKLSLCLGSFYEIKLPKDSLDFIVMSQAFHHADNPDKLLQEVHRVLKKDGFLIMIGELFISKTRYFKCYLNYIISLIVSSKYFPYLLVNRFSIFKRLKLKKLIGSFQEIYFPPDPVLGDHYYLKSQYEKFFSRNGFNFYRITSKKSNHLAYIIFKK